MRLRVRSVTGRIKTLAVGNAKCGSRRVENRVRIDGMALGWVRGVASKLVRSKGSRRFGKRIFGF